jgi:hypothetical protein
VNSLYVGILTVIFNWINQLTVYLKPGETPWSWAVIEKQKVAQLLKNIPIFFGTRRFFSVFTRALQWPLFWGTSTQFIPPYLLPLRSILILYTHLRLGFPSSSFLLAFPSKSYMLSTPPNSYYMPCPSHSSWYHRSDFTCCRVQVITLLII